MLQFPYQTVPLIGRAPPSLPASTTERWRPFVPIGLFAPNGLCRIFGRALIDPGSDDTVFPLAVVNQLAIALHPDTGHKLRWRGQHYTLRFGDVELGLSDNTSTYRWPATIGFSDAPIAYRLFGFCDVTFRGDARVLELERNNAFPGTIS
jgi:hypothetical protein